MALDSSKRRALPKKASKSRTGEDPPKKQSPKLDPLPALGVAPVVDEGTTQIDFTGMPFPEAFANARAAGLEDFWWNGEHFNTQLASTQKPSARKAESAAKTAKGMDEEAAGLMRATPTNLVPAVDPMSGAVLESLSRPGSVAFPGPAPKIGPPTQLPSPADAMAAIQEMAQPGIPQGVVPGQPGFAGPVMPQLPQGKSRLPPTQPTGANPSPTGGIPGVAAQMQAATPPQASAPPGAPLPGPVVGGQNVAVSDPATRMGQGMGNLQDRLMAMLQHFGF